MGHLIFAGETAVNSFLLFQSGFLLGESGSLGGKSGSLEVCGMEITSEGMSYSCRTGGREDGLGTQLEEIL